MRLPFLLILGCSLLFVNRASQPCLIGNDLKKGARRGRIALWIGEGTDARFASLRVRGVRP
jgi:hypothetical protein